MLMNMIVTPGFQIYEFKSSTELITSSLAHCQNLVWSKNTHNYLSSLISYDQLFSWFQTCIDRVTDEIYPNLYKNNLKFKISAAWANKSEKSHYHHKHMHPNSWWSGIYYLTDHELGGTTKFYSDNPWYKFENADMFFLQDLVVPPSNITSYKPVAGNLIIFPSNIMHDTTPNEDDHDRYTISFNVFPSGVLGLKHTTNLNLNVKYA